MPYEHNEMPFEIGETCYGLIGDKIVEFIVYSYYHSEHGVAAIEVWSRKTLYTYFTLSSIGEILFHTRDEAVERLKELGSISQYDNRYV